MTTSLRRLYRRTAAVVVCLAATLVSPSLAAAQTPASATLTQWDLFSATGGNGTASQNVTAIVMDATGSAGAAGTVWVNLQYPLPRLGRLDPSAATNNYVEWIPVTSAQPGGSALGLALNRGNGDVWMAMQGDPSFVVKMTGNNFRKYRGTYPMIPQGIAVAADNSVIAALPAKNAGGIGDAIIRIPRDPVSGRVTMTLWQVGGAPRHVSIDDAGNIWYTPRTTNKLARLNPSTAVVTEWLLPAGTNPAGVRASGSTVCVVSEGVAGALSGIEHCLNPATNQFTQYSRATGDGFDYPQQTAVNSNVETFITEQNGSSISFVAFAAQASAPVVTVTPTTRTVAPKTTTLNVTDYTVTPATYTVASTPSTIPAVDNGSGYLRFSIPTQALTYPTDQTGYPQPVGITPVFNDQGRGTGAVFFGESFDGPVLGRQASARVSRLELSSTPAGPVIVSDPASLRFDAVTGGSAPASQSITISEASGQALAWTATKTKSWLTLNPSNGTTPSTLTVSVNPTGVAAGTDTDTITIDDGPGNASAKTVTVTLNVTGQPTICAYVTASQSTCPASTMSFTATALGERTPPQQVSITNTGDATLDWTAASNQSWLVVGPTSGTAPSTLSVLVDPLSLSAGSYSGVITLTSATATNSPQTVNVSVTVSNAPPLLSLSPGSFTFTATRGATAPAAQALTISNTGGGTLAWGASTSDSWIVATPSSGSLTGGNSGTTNITVDAGTMARGTYNGTVTITDPHVSNSPQSVAVSMTVLSAQLGVSPTSVVESVLRTAASPANRVVTISNSGDVALNYTATVLDDVSWLSIAGGASGTVGVGGNASLTLAFSTGALAQGIHTAQIKIEDANATNSPQLVNVTLTVTAPTIAVAPASMTFGVTQGSNPSAQTLTVNNTGDGPLTFTPAVATTSGGSWLSISPSGAATIAAGGNAAFTITAISAALTPGSYSGSITITDSTATNSPVVVPVSLTVTAVGVLTVSPTTIAVNALRNGPSPANQNVTISNTGGQTFTYSTAVTSGGSWLSIVSGGSGTLAASGSQSLVLAINSTGLAKGVYTGTIDVTAPGATNSPTTITVTLTVQAATISASPASLTFTAGRTTNPAAQTTVLTNTGDATLNFSTSASTTSGGSWLAVSPASGTLAPGNSVTLTATVTSASLASGSYSGSIAVTDADASNSPYSVPVSLTVTPAATIALGASTLTFSTPEGVSPPNQTVLVSNTGDGTLTFTPQVSTVSGGSWLSVSPAGQSTVAGGGSQLLTVSIVTSGLTPGSYSGSIVISDATATNSPQTVTVNLTVAPAPVISRSPAALTFTAARTKNPAPNSQTISVTNTGSATLNFNAAASMATGSGWLAVSPSSGTLAPGASTNLTATVTSAALATGTYSGTITISDPAASNSPQTTAVSLTVTPAPTISLGAASLSFSVVQTLSPSNQTVTVTNSGDASLVFTPQVSTVSGGSWLSVSPAGQTTLGAGANQVLTVSVNSASLAPGTYTGTIRVDDANATNTPQDVAVTLTVTAAPVISRSPSTLTFSSLRGRNPSPNTQTITLQNTGGASMNWTAAASMTNGAGWLAVSPTSGTLAAGGSTTLTVTITSTALTAGSYSGNVAISAAGAPAGNSPQNTAVSLTVSGAPTISLNAASETFSVTQTLNPATQTVTVTNTGDASLVFTPEVTTVSGGSWLAVSPSTQTTIAAGGNQVFTITVTSASLAPGSYSGNIRFDDANATNTPQDLPISLTVNAAPVISTTPGTLTFTAKRQANPTPNTQTITLQNTGGASMNWTAAATMTNGTGWLAVSPTSGTLAAGGSTTLTVTITSSALAAGSFSGNIAVSAAGAPAGNSPQNTAVSLTVSAAPFISLNAASKTFSVTQTLNPATQTVTVTNTGDPSLVFTPVVTTTSGGSWLSVSPSGQTTLGAGANQVLTISVASASLAPGTYTGNIQIADANAANSPQNVAVTLTVNAAPVISTTPASHTFTAIRSQNPSPNTQTITLQNTGGATMNWTAAATMTNGTGWLAVSPTSGTLAAGGTTTLTVTITSTALAAGSYSGNVAISAAGAPTGNSPQNTSVSLTVVPAPTIVLSATTAMTFSGNKWAVCNSTPLGNTVTAQTFTIQNSGDTGTTLNFTVAAATNSGGNWLLVSPTSGTDAVGGGTVTVTTSIDLVPGGTPLVAGTYTGSVTVSDPNSSNGSITRTVTLTVGSSLATMCISPTTITVGNLQRGATSTTFTATVQNVGEAAFGGTLATAVSSTSGTVTRTPTSINNLAAGATQVISYTVTAGTTVAQNGTAQSGTVTFTRAGVINTGMTDTLNWTQTAVPSTISIPAGTLTFSGARFTTCNAVNSGTAPTNQTFVLTNTGDSALTLTAGASTATGGNWLSISPTSGTVAANGTQTMTVSINMAPGGTPLTAGTYNGTLTMSAPEATNSPQTKAVTLTVNAAGAVMCVTPVSAALGTIPKSVATTTNFVVSNVGDSGSIAWSTTAPVAVTRHTLSRTPTSGTATTSSSSTITFSVTPASNATAGAKSTTFTVTATGQTTVTLTITWTI